MATSKTMSLYSRSSTYRVLTVHNAYQQPGGEDRVVDAEMALLKAYGHQVYFYGRNNNQIRQMNPARALSGMFWSRSSMHGLDRILQQVLPEVIHVHNIFPLISPAIYWLAERYGIPVVQTLHNFRLLCPQAMFLRDDHVCEDCLGRTPWRAVTHRCYRHSFTQSGASAAMLVFHRRIGSWRKKVTRYIALNEFCRQKFIAGGLPRSRISIKPNFVDMPLVAKEDRRGGLFVGRLSPEKGTKVLIRAAAVLPNRIISVIGAGPDGDAIASSGRLVTKGHQDSDQVMAAMRKAAYLVMPSISYETFGLVAVEAFACGLPVIASRLGAMQEMVEDGRTGLLFRPGNAEDFAEKIAWAEQHPAEMRVMGKNARREYESKYTPEINYRQLIAVYDDAVSEVTNCGR